MIRLFKFGEDDIKKARFRDHPDFKPREFEIIGESVFVWTKVNDVSGPGYYYSTIHSLVNGASPDNRGWDLVIDEPDEVVVPRYNLGNELRRLTDRIEALERWTNINGDNAYRNTPGPSKKP